MITSSLYFHLNSLDNIGSHHGPMNLTMHFVRLEIRLLSIIFRSVHNSLLIILLKPNALTNFYVLHVKMINFCVFHTLILLQDKESIQKHNHKYASTFYAVPFLSHLVLSGSNPSRNLEKEFYPGDTVRIDYKADFVPEAVPRRVSLHRI